ncbi:MAG: hypothetical protein IH968_14515 [Gemmatimonadetes bacterium]|nr:hypothetical protein [Gemmatimonadota bacterium]
MTDEGGRESTNVKLRRPKQGGIPPVTMLFVGVGVGFAVAGWWGLIFGGAIGFFLWRSRA